MKQLLITIDDITSEVIDFRTKLQYEFNMVENDMNAYVKRAVKVSFMLGTDYFDGAAHLLSHNEYMAGTFVRANIEVLADMILVLNDPDQAENYINKGMKQFASKMHEAFGKTKEEAYDQKLLHFAQVNPWAIKSVDADGNPKYMSITDRITFAEGNGFQYLMNVYAFYCFFAHPNPGVTRFGTTKRMEQRQQQIASMLCDNNVIIIEMMKIAITTWGLTGVTIQELDDLAAKIPKLGLMHTHISR